MNHAEVKDRILQNLYQAFFSADTDRNLKALAEQEGWERTPFWNLIDRMTQEGLIKCMTAGGCYQIDSRGVLNAEEAGLAPEGLVKTNREVRTQILLSLAKVHEERGNLHTAQNVELMEQTGVNKNIARGNLLMLLALGYAESSGNAGSKITYPGLKAVEEYRKNKGLADEFEAISKMSPRPRGRALQKLIAKVIERHGWGQDESVRTYNEEMDVIVFRDREYYLLECKWEKGRIGAPVIRELFGKLNNRVDVRGIVVSVSGFTGGAVKQVKDYIGHRIILLFGGEDVRALCYGQTTFDDLLNAKYKELVTKREVKFK